MEIKTDQEGLTLHFPHDQVKVLWELMVYAGYSSHQRHINLNSQISQAAWNYMRNHGFEVKTKGDQGHEDYL